MTEMVSKRENKGGKETGGMMERGWREEGDGTVEEGEQTNEKNKMTNRHQKNFWNLGIMAEGRKNNKLCWKEN